MVKNVKWVNFTLGHFQVRNKACQISDERKCNLKVELSHLTLFTITDYFSHITWQIFRYFVQLHNEKNYLTSTICGLMKNKYDIRNYLMSFSFISQ